MEIAGKIFLGILGLMVLCIIAGFIDAWWTQRQREKADKERRGQR